MRVSIILIRASVQALQVAALPVEIAESPFTSTSPVLASSTSTPIYDWSSGYVSQFNIHQSCNATERHEITAGLEQAILVAKHAKEHGTAPTTLISFFSSHPPQQLQNLPEILRKGPTAPVIGWLDKIATANRAGVIFRCDDPDQNCKTQGRHHRGSNASAETVICPLSYTSRLPLTALCTRGFDMATGRANNSWAADLMHRLYHVPLVGEDEVGHYADGYTELLELAKDEDYRDAARNNASLSYFALEAYAYDISILGEGCVGKVVEEDHYDHDYGHGSSPTSSAVGTNATATTSVNPMRVIPSGSTKAEALPASGTAAGQECHTHDDGSLHCV